MLIARQRVTGLVILHLRQERCKSDQEIFFQIKLWTEAIYIGRHNRYNWAGGRYIFSQARRTDYTKPRLELVVPF